MKNNRIIELFIGLILTAILVVILNPWHMWMPDMVHMTILILAALVFGILAVFILQERPHDERDTYHRSIAARSAFLVGSTLLLLGIVRQGIVSHIDPWLVWTLIGMVAAKMLTRLYTDLYQ